MPVLPLPSIPARAFAIVAAAAPLHALLALSTDLSPDEAYYLCAAREGGLLPPLRDHPPLLPWLLRLSDQLTFLPLELRVRLWPIASSIALGLLCVELARRRNADREGCCFAAWIAGWALLPTTAGFVATPDGPALLAIVSGILWAAPGFVSPPRSSDPSLTPHPEGSGDSLLESNAGTLAVGVLLALGSLSKVIVLPAALLAALLARSQTPVARLALLVPSLLLAPLLLPSLWFQLDHAFLQQRPVWSPASALLALGEAVLVQALLWSPWVLVWGARAARRLPLPDQGILASISALVALSAFVRAMPPEANWWAPAALVVLIGAALASARVSTRVRTAVLVSVLLPTAIASIHTLRPFLPLSPEADPTARLHGWSHGSEPRGAAGVGPYGPSAELCIYRGDCEEIRSYFKRMVQRTSGSF